MADVLEVFINGRRVQVARGTTVAAAVCTVHDGGFRRSITGEHRAPLCGMGICMECRLRVDGRELVRTCQLLCTEGMQVEVDE